jgi:1,4-dihydroxy-6-naphthoate synthase
VDCKVEKVFMRFDKIIPAILSEEIDAGVIIHESRFTYTDFSLYKILDLGEFWERETGAHIPLGGIAVSKRIEIDLIKLFDKYLKQSIKYGFENFDEAKGYIKKYSQELDESVIKSHIELYVNEYTYSLGEEGVKALNEFYKTGFNKGIFPENSLKICGANGIINQGKKIKETENVFK